MFEILLLIFVITAVFELVNLSFRQERGYLFFFVVVLAAGLMLAYPAATTVNLKDLLRVTERDNLFASITLVLIAESFIHLLLSGQYAVKEAGLRKEQNKSRFLMYIPSPLFLTGLFFCQIVLFNQVEGISFGWLATIMVSGIAITLFLVPLILRKLISSTERLLLRFRLGLIRVITALALPLVAVGAKPAGTNLEFNSIDLGLLLGVLLICGGTGYFMEPVFLYFKKYLRKKNG